MSQLSPTKDVLYCLYCRTKMEKVKYDSHASLLFNFETVTFYCNKCKLAYVILPGADRVIITIVTRKKKEFHDFATILGLKEEE